MTTENDAGTDLFSSLANLVVTPSPADPKNGAKIIKKGPQTDAKITIKTGCGNVSKKEDKIVKIRCKYVYLSDVPPPEKGSEPDRSAQSPTGQHRAQPTRTAQSPTGPGRHRA